MGGRTSFPIVSLPSERIILVTGANTGVGYEIAKWCAMMGATVILACRSEERAMAAIDKMQKEFQAEKAMGQAKLTDKSALSLEFAKVDLSSFQSVLEFCENFKRSGRPLHVLVCNAGLGCGPYQKSVDGFEMTLQVNYLSQFLIMAKLLPIIKRSGPDCRILLMSSRAHESGTFDLETMNYTGPPGEFKCWDYYGRSKLYQIMQTVTMTERLKDSNITINCMHPGVVDTELWRDVYTSGVKCLLGCSKMCCAFRTPFEGAVTAIDLVTNPKYAGISGHYWIDGKITASSRTSRDKSKQESLWRKTLSLLNQYITEEEKNFIEGIEQSVK